MLDDFEIKRIQKAIKWAQHTIDECGRDINDCHVCKRLTKLIEVSELYLESQKVNININTVIDDDLLIEKCPICNNPLEDTYDFNENGEQIFGEICTYCCYEHYEE